MLVINLIFLWHVIKASEHLLVVAAERSSGELKQYFERHLEEERGHALWLAEDLQSVGVDVTRTQLPWEAVEMVGSVYYMIFHADPAALLGYTHLLEGWPMPEARLRELQEQYPASLLRTTLLHAKQDPGHLAELNRIIDGLPPERRALVDQTRALSREHLLKALAKVTTADVAHELPARANA
jgi:hypothetical protein